MSDLNIETTYGSIMSGSLFAFGLSGVLTTQVAVYWKLYGDKEELLYRRILVIFVWLLDCAHSALIWAACWFYFVTHFTNKAKLDFLPTQVALTVVSTAIQTMIYHFHFASKIHVASKRNWLVTGPIVFLAFARLVAASVSTSEMIKLKAYSAFAQVYPGWVFTLGLSLSSGVDILVSGWMCYFLWKLKAKSTLTKTVQMVDNLILYTLENGAATCLFTTASLVCWLCMPYNLVFLGLHFVIGKLYANSLVASLITRKVFQMRSGGAITFGDPSSLSGPSNLVSNNIGSGFIPSFQIPKSPLSPRSNHGVQSFTKSGDSIALGIRKIEVQVQQDVQRTSDDLDMVTAKHLAAKSVK
ncbi:hypothetical protein DL96DRAFT_849957 [Flagelloscypha sp. PMI_526]|nr:hypothetical protein DL96DRAFT_849957 [Flagelloscypha sp. PMI_526]